MTMNNNQGEYMTEIWKDIGKYEGSFQVSNLGNVRSLDRVMPVKPTKRNKSGRRFFKGKVFTPDCSREYSRVCLYERGKGTHYSIHRLVAQAFIPNPENKPCVNHIDGNKLNNNAGNLEWCTYGENATHAYNMGLRKGLKGSTHHNSKLTEDVVSAIKYKYTNIGPVELADKYNISASTVCDIRKGRTWKHI